MSSGTQLDVEWQGSLEGPTNAGAAGVAHLTDEEILGTDPPSSNGGYGGLGPVGGAASTQRTVIPSEARNLSSIEDGVGDAARRDSSGNSGPRNDKFGNYGAGGQAGSSDAKTGQAEACPTGEMPSWMAAAAADPAHGGEAAALWREHQEFRSAFASPEEARAVKELLPGGVRDVLSLREATQSVERIDAALFSGDSRAQAEVVAEIARANPAAFRSLFAEAARVLGELGAPGAEARGREAENFDGSAANGVGTRTRQESVIANEARNLSSIDGASVDESQRDSSGANSPQHDNAGRTAAGTAVGTANFDAAAYASFERATNDAVARDVRGSIGSTLARVMPEGVAEGAARHIGEDIFQEIHRALAADRTLSEQVAAVLSGRRFGSAEQQRVASLLAARARQLVPGVARRVIGEWTSSVLNTARAKSARQAAAASRVDIAAPGGSRDAMPLRAMGPREVNYASMSDEQILGM